MRRERGKGKRCWREANNGDDEVGISADDEAEAEKCNDSPRVETICLPVPPLALAARYAPKTWLTV